MAYIYSDIPSDILCGILPAIYSDILSGIYSDILSGIYSGILSGIYSGIHSGIHFGILSGIMSGILSGIYSDILSDMRTAGPQLRAPDLSAWGPAVPTEIWSSQDEEEEEGEKEEEKVTLLKSRGAHLAGVEIFSIGSTNGGFSLIFHCENKQSPKTNLYLLYYKKSYYKIL